MNYLIYEIGYRFGADYGQNKVNLKCNALFVGPFLRIGESINCVENTNGYIYLTLHNKSWEK
jgi:hypothetical protein